MSAPMVQLVGANPQESKSWVRIPQLPAGAGHMAIDMFKWDQYDLKKNILKKKIYWANTTGSTSAHVQLGYLGYCSSTENRYVVVW